MDLAQAYAYCPVCGSERKVFEPVSPFHCDVCSHTCFFGPVAAVGAIVTNDLNQVLLIRRARDPGKGKLGMPGGFIDRGETAESAMRREIFEELGIPVAAPRYLMTAPNHYVYRGIAIPVLDIFYHAPIEGSPTIAAEPGEVSDWMWTDLTDEVLSEMAFISNRQALQFFREHG